jgi:predicted phosphodiesterase
MIGMTMRHYGTVAVLADIHANLPALEAVLAEPDVIAADAVVLLGDIALGPMPAQTLDLLAGLGDRAVWVHGNCERVMIASFDAAEEPGPDASWAAASASLLTRAHRDRLDRLPLTVTLEVGDLGPVLFCHASPRRDDEMVLVDSPIARWVDVLADVAAPTILCGHTHMQFDRRVADRRVVNAGSIGQPYGQPGAAWALLGAGVTLRHTLYDTTAAAARIGTSAYPDAAGWAAEYVLNHYSDTAALADFTTTADEQESERRQGE